MPQVVNHMPRMMKEGKIVKQAKGNAKNDEYQTMSLRSKIANMYLKGMSQWEIAEQLQCSQPNISYHLKIIREEWLSSTVRDFDAMKAQELAKIDHLEAVAWDSFKRSQQKLIGEEMVDQPGDPRFLSQVSWCIDKRCKIAKIDEDAPTNNNMLIINFDQIFGKPADLEDDPIERRIAQARVIESVPMQPKPLSPQNGKRSKT